MSIMIHRDDRDYGPYTLDEVTDLVYKKVLREDDNAFIEGGAVWRPLGELLAEQRAEGAQPRATSGPGLLPLLGVLAVVLLLLFALVFELRSSLEPLLNLARSFSGGSR
jgi:hypothetical protein